VFIQKGRPELKLSVERKPQSLVVLDITADDAEFAAAVDTAIKKAARTIQIPGFRKGKAPASRVEKLYGREMFVQEATDEVMQKLYADAIKEADITPVGTPEVDIVQMEPVQFVVTVPVYPEIKLGDYSAVRVDPVDAATTDEDVEEVITRLQKQQSPWVEVTEERSPVDGDQGRLRGLRRRYRIPGAHQGRPVRPRRDQPPDSACRQAQGAEGRRGGHLRTRLCRG
jgi:trigger factor